MTCPFEVAGLSIERACCTSMTAAHIGCMAIQLGMEDICIAGGMESHSHFPTPMITEDTDIMALAEELGKTRGLPNAKIFEKVDINAVASMGLIAEKLAEMYGITREDLNKWAWQSNMRAAAAQREGKFKHEIIPVEGTLPDGTVKLIDYDQGVKPDSKLEKIRTLPPHLQTRWHGMRREHLGRERRSCSRDFHVQGEGEEVGAGAHGHHQGAWPG